jgi:Domain of unknown function (DUF3471)/WD40-like Beta Propeller Repeat
MKTVSLVLLFLFAALVPTHAQSTLTGTWQTEVPSGGLWTVELRLDGDNLTGTVGMGVGDPVEIYEGKIEGNTVVFKCTSPDGDRTITFTGKVNGGEIAFTRDVQVHAGGNPLGNGIFGGSTVRQFTAKRVPDGQAPARPKGAPFPRQLTLFDRQGKVLRTLGEPGFYDEPVLSPDGTRVAVVRAGDIWVFDVSSGTNTRITSSPEPESSPVWSRDGSQVAYFRENYYSLFRKASNGTGSEELLYQHSLGTAMHLTDWSVDGRFLSFNSGGVLWAVPVNGERKAVELLREEFYVIGGPFSPDSRFLAYGSDETGRNEIYVQPFDPASRFSPGGRKWQVSRGGLGMVQWRGDGKELFYLGTDGGVMAVEVSTTPAFKVGLPKRLFRAPGTIPDPRLGSISRNGQRVVFAVPIPPARKEVTVAPQILAKYTGTYVRPAEVDDVVVTLEGKQLVLQLPDPEGLQKIALSAESETAFFFRGINGDVEFFTDDKGAVTHFILYRGGPARKWTRK